MDAHSWAYQSRCPTHRGCLLADSIVEASLDSLDGHWAVLIIASDGGGGYKTHLFSTLKDGLTAGILKVARKAMITSENGKPYIERLRVPTQEDSLECGNLVIEFLDHLARAVWFGSNPEDSIARAVTTYCATRNGTAPPSTPQATSPETSDHRKQATATERGHSCKGCSQRFRRKCECTRHEM